MDVIGRAKFSKWDLKAPTIKIARVVAMVFIHVTWLGILSAFFVINIDQPELRAAGFFKNDPAVVTKVGLILCWSIPIAFPIFYNLIQLLRIQYAEDEEDN